MASQERERRPPTGTAARRAAKAAYRQPARSARDNGAPVSDRHRSATALRKGRTPNSGTTPLSAQSPPAGMAPPVRERRPLASSPGGGRHRGPQGRKSRVPPTRPKRTRQWSAGLRPASQRDSAAKGKNPELPHDAPLGAVPSSRDSTARQGTPTSGQFSRCGPAPRPAGPRKPRTANPMAPPVRERRSPTGIAARQRCEREEPRTPAWRPSRRSPYQERWHRPAGNAGLQTGTAPQRGANHTTPLPLTAHSRPQSPPRRTPCKAPSPPSSCSRAKPKKP